MEDSLLATAPATTSVSGGFKIEVADEKLAFRSVLVEGHRHTGRGLAESVGFNANGAVVVLHFLANGDLLDIRPDDPVDMELGCRRFVIVKGNGVHAVSLDGSRIDLASRVVSGCLLRRLGRVPQEMEIYLDHSDRAGRRLDDLDLVDTIAPGFDRFVTRKRIFKLNVQGVILDLASPIILVRDALERAGFNPDQGWQIFLKVHGEPKRSVALTDTIDLCTPGIDKLRLTPKEINNGEAVPKPRHDFALLDVDAAHLARIGLDWETVVEQNRRWLVIHDYPVPEGYTVKCAILALEIPPTYPGAQIYGFFAFPPLALASGRTVASTQMRGIIFGKEFHGWSRNRGAIPWNPAIDKVATQLALVEAALSKEIGE